MHPDYKKIGAGLIAGASLAGSAVTAINHKPCDYGVEQGDKKTCLTVEEMSAARTYDKSWQSDKSWDTL